MHIYKQTHRNRIRYLVVGLESQFDKVRSDKMVRPHCCENEINRIEIRTFGGYHWDIFIERINSASNFLTTKSSMLEIQPPSNVLCVNICVVHLQ